MDLEGCWMSRFHFLEVGSWILKVAGCSVVCVIFLGGGIMDFQGVKVSIFGVCAIYTLHIYHICYFYHGYHVYQKHVVSHGSLLRFSLQSSIWVLATATKICTKKRKNTQSSKLST